MSFLARHSIVLKSDCNENSVLTPHFLACVQARTEVGYKAMSKLVPRSHTVRRSEDLTFRHSRTNWDLATRLGHVYTTFLDSTLSCCEKYSGLVWTELEAAKNRRHFSTRIQSSLLVVDFRFGSILCSHYSRKCHEIFSDMRRSLSRPQ